MPWHASYAFPTSSWESGSSLGLWSAQSISACGSQERLFYGFPCVMCVNGEAFHVLYDSEIINPPVFGVMLSRSRSLSPCNFTSEISVVLVCFVPNPWCFGYHGCVYVTHAEVGSQDASEYLSYSEFFSYSGSHASALMFSRFYLLYEEHNLYCSGNLI